MPRMAFVATYPPQLCGITTFTADLAAATGSHAIVAVLGMIQEFTVTPAGTEVGPLPEAASDEMAPDEGSAPEEEEDGASE